MHACLSFPVSLSWRSNVFHLSIPVPILHSSARQEGSDLCSVKKKKKLRGRTHNFLLFLSFCIVVGFFHEAFCETFLYVRRMPGNFPYDPSMADKKVSTFSLWVSTVFRAICVEKMRPESWRTVLVLPSAVWVDEVDAEPSRFLACSICNSMCFNPYPLLY